MSRVSPCRFEAKSSRKMDSSPPQKGYPTGVPTFYSSLSCCLCSLSAVLLSDWGTQDLGLAALLMRSCFAWLVITEWLSPLLVEDVFCFWTQMGFSHWHEPIFDCVGKGLWALHSKGCKIPLFISASLLLMYNYPSEFAGQINLWDKRGDETFMGVNSYFSFYASINMFRHSCLLCWTVSYVSYGNVEWYEQ